MCEPEEGKCLWSNDFLNEFFGLDSSKMKGYGWLSVVDSQDRDNVYEVWTCSIKNGTPYSCQYNITNQRTGEKSLIEAFATAVLNDSDKIVCYVGWVIKIK
jgi:hypothetical protein